MINQRAFQNLLKRKLSEIQGKRSGYSLRSFAKVLRIGAGPLSQILNGVRNVSEKMAEQILDRLEVSPSERSALYLYSSSEVIPDQAYVIPEDDFKHISSWYHYAIISLTQVKDFDSDPKWIARRLGISENQVQDAVSRLIRLKLLKRTLNHSLKVTQRKAKTIDVC